MASSFARKAGNGAGLSLASAVAAFPLFLCMKDSFYSLCRVKGSSMEPNLRDGDLLLIRKADFPIMRWFKFTNKDDENDHLLDDSDLDDVSGPMMRRRRLREYEYQLVMRREDKGVWLRCPPWPQRGQVVTYRSPYKYPYELCVKRVIAVAGQVVETQEGRKAIDINRIWAEGDNQENSSDSRHYGEINQKLVVGVADYVVWPPWRVGKVKKIVDDERSYWA